MFIIWRGRCLLLALLFIGMSTYCLNVERKVLALLLIIFLIIRLLWSQQRTMILCFLLCCIAVFFFFSSYHDALRATYSENKRDVVVIPNWATVQQRQSGYYVDGKMEGKNYRLFVEKQKPLYGDALKGKGTITNGQKERFRYGYSERVQLLSHHYAGSIRLQHAKSVTESSRPYLFRIQEAIMKKVKTLPYWCQRYVQMLIFGFHEQHDQTSERYAQLGMSHLFSLSGLNVSVFLFLWRFPLSRCKVTKEMILYTEGVYLIIIYFLCYQSIGFLRSILMHELYQWQKRYNIGLSPIDIWSLSLCVHLLFNPYLLLTASGVLSYGMSFLVMVIYSRPIPILQKHFLFFMLSVPLLSRYFFQVPVISLITNLIFVPLFTFFFLPLCLFILLSLYICPLSMIYLMIENIFALFQRSLYYIPNISPLIIPPLSSLCLILYVMCFLFFLKDRLRPYVLLISLCVIYIINYIPLYGEITMIDIGQGDSLFIRAPLSRHVSLIDCGGKVFSNSGKSNASYTLFPFLKSKGVTAIDALYITHADKDHCGDMVELAQNIPIKRIYYSAGCERNTFFNHALIQLKKKNITLIPLVGQKQWQTKDIQWQMLYPLKEGEGKNNDSLVFRLTTPHRSFLLTGDLEAKGEDVMFPFVKPTDVLKVGHHGSRTATSESFLCKVHPSIAWVSCGLNNRFSHPHYEVIDRLKKQSCLLYRTDKQGTVTYYFNAWQEKIVTAH